MSAAIVGIVLVSHSAELAAGAAHLAGQVSGGTVTILSQATKVGGLRPYCPPMILPIGCLLQALPG